MRRRIIRAVRRLRWASTALTIGAGIAAVVSGWYTVDARCSLLGRSCACTMEGGTLALYAWDFPLWYEGGLVVERLTWDEKPYEWLEFGGAWRYPTGYSDTVTYLKVPLWLVAGILAGAATAGIWARDSLKPCAPGRCGSCGYAMLNSSVCPECGTPSATTK